MRGLDVPQLIVDAGLTTLTFCARADVSMPTYYKFINHEKLSPLSIMKIEKAIKTIQAEQKAEMRARARAKAPAEAAS